MTDHLAAEVDRWLAAEVRTTWPGKSGDCCDTAERADMAAWFAAQLTAFDAWRAAERRNGANSTQGDVVSVLLEAAELAKGTLPPPKPGTHESDLCNQRVVTCRACLDNQHAGRVMTETEHREYSRALQWTLAKGMLKA